MAFKPFEFFRKRMKFLLAILTIFTMIIFIGTTGVVSSNRSSGTEWGGRLRRVFGYGKYVAVVEGQALEAEDLQALARRRQAAFQFLSHVQRQGTLNAYEQANINQNDLTRVVRLLDPQGRMQLNFNLLSFYIDFALNPQNPQMSQRFSEADRKFLTDMKGKLASKALAEGMDAQRAAITAHLLFLQFHTAEGLVEFVLWQKKADELGIVMSPAKVTDDLIKLGAKSITADDLPRIATKAKIGMDSSSLLNAVGEEVRVMIARGVFMGKSKGGYAFEEPTPVDLWEAYTKVKTELDVAVLPVPVNYKGFLDKVPDPSPAELQEFYDKYKKQEPDPARETPGFRVPKMFQVAFLYGEMKGENDTTKFYEGWVKVQDTLPAMLNRSLADYFTPPRNLVEAAATYQRTPAHYAREEPFVLIQTGAKPEEANYYRAPVPGIGEPWPTAETVEKQNVARLAMELAMAAVLPKSPAVLAGIHEMNKVRTERIPRAKAQSLEVTNWVAAAGLGLPGILSYPPRLALATKYRSFSDVANIILDQEIEGYRALLMQSDLGQLKGDLDDYAKSDEFRRKFQDWRAAKVRAEKANQPIPPFEPPPFPSEEYRKAYKKWKVAKSEAERMKTESPKFQPPPAGESESQKALPLSDYLERYAKPRGLHMAGMKEPRTKAELFTEKGDSPMGTLLKPVFLTAGYTNDQILDFLSAPRGLFEATEINAPWERPREFAVFWRTRETDARTPALAECEAKVREAWKLDKARAIAEKTANDIAGNEKEVKGIPDGFRKLIDKEKDFEGAITPGYSEKRFQRYELADPLRRAGSADYRLAAASTYFEHPVDNLIDQTLEKLQKPGDTLVVTNKPKTFFYVLFLRERRQPRSSDEVWIRQFDQEVVYPETAKQLHVTGKPISEWVAAEAKKKYDREWETYVKAVTKFNPEEAERLKSFLENLNRYGGGSGEEEF